MYLKLNYSDTKNSSKYRPINCLATINKIKNSCVTVMIKEE
jgi:hypothetical protein